MFATTPRKWRTTEDDGNVVPHNPVTKTMAALHSRITQFKNSAFYRKDTLNLAYKVSAKTMPVTVH